MPLGGARVTAIRGVAISNPEKIWWPDEGFTKLDIVRYYDAVWPQLRPWLRDRPLTAERCPDGMRGSCFYQKNFPAGSQPVAAPRLRQRAASTGKDVEYLVGGDRKTLLGMVNLGCIAMHVMNARAASIERPGWRSTLIPRAGRSPMPRGRDSRSAGCLTTSVSARSRKPPVAAASMSLCHCGRARIRVR